jgi:GGDEF domain-containing protein
MGAPAFESNATAKAARPMVALDGATGVVTRNALLSRLEEMGELAPTAPLSFVVVKVSGLAQAGDEALKPIAARVRELIRATDVVGRLTGTTFGVALQGTGATAAGAVAARLAHHLNRIAELHPAVCITVSAATGTGVNAEMLPVAAMDSYEPCCG